MYNLTHPLTRVSVEVERHKLIALAYLGKELLPLITLRNELIQTRKANQTLPNEKVEVAITELTKLDTAI